MKIPKEKRRGGQRDDSTLTVGLNKKELVELLERTRRRCEEYERKQEELILKRSGILIVKLEKTVKVTPKKRRKMTPKS